MTTGETAYQENQENRAYQVDVEEVSASASAMGRITAEVSLARGTLRDVTQGVGEWAADGELGSAFERLRAGLGWAVDQAQAAADGLHDCLASAARHYAAAEASVQQASRESRDGMGARGR